MKRYRIIRYEKKDKIHHNQMYVVEYRYLLFFWRPIMDKSFPYSPKIFMTLYAAEYFVGHIQQIGKDYKRKIEKYL